jgi:hypothetical protein
MSHQIAEKSTPQWVYTTIRVYDAGRVLKPTHVSFDHVIFESPPCLTSMRIAIVVANGDNEFRSEAEVLPHDRGATEIPIRLDPATKAP